MRCDKYSSTPTRQDYRRYILETTTRPPRSDSSSLRNPVHVAAYHGNTRALELLEEYGFDLAALDKFGRVRFSTGSFFSYFF